MKAVRKGTTLLVLATVLSLAVVAAGHAQSLSEIIEGARREGRLVIYHNADVAAMQETVNAFRQAYPFISVEPVRLASAALNQRFEAEMSTGHSPVDIVQSSWSAEVKNWAANGWILDYAPTSAAELPEQYKPLPGVHLITLGAQIMAVNTFSVRPEDYPKSFEDLLDPKWQGRIGVNPPWRSAQVVDWVWFVENVLKVPDFGERVAAQRPFLSSGSADLAQAVVRGEIDAAWVLDRSCYQFKLEGAPIECIWPSEHGVALYTRAVMISADSPNPNAAKLFMHWLLSRDGMAAYQEKNAMFVVHPDVPVLPGLPSLEDIIFHVVDPDVVLADTPGLVARWEALFGR